MRLVKAAAVGFVAGALATIPMSGAFFIAQKRGAIRELPPHKAVRTQFPEYSQQQRKRMAAVAHLVVGGSAGTLYGAMPSRLPRGPVSGILHGLGVWIVGYEFVMPAITGMPRAHRDSRDRAATILIAHLVYGGALGLISRVLQRGR